MANSLQLNFIKKFTGYKNYRDITNLAPTDLIAGSQNVFVEDGVKVAVRGGSNYLGAQGTVGVNTNPSWMLAHRIHSQYDKFVNNQGVIMPFRIFYSGTTAQGDVMETWLPEYVAGVEQPTKKWYQVNATAPSNPINSVHKWYFAEWYDSLSGTNRIVFTYGSTIVQSYTGGFAPIVSITPTTITTNGTWRSKGFVNAPEGINTIVVNVAGVPTEIPLASGNFDTNTITVASTAGIVVDDVAFQAFNHDTIDNETTPTGFNADVCATLNNQVYYIDWRQRNVLVSWDRNRLAYSSNIVYQGSSGLNDAVFSGTYTGTSTDTYKAIITAVHPATNQQTYQGTGTQIFFDTSGYSATGKNEYEMKCAYTQVITGKSGTYVGTFIDGEIIIGGTSGAVGIIYQTDPININLVAGLHTLSGQFEVNETVTGQNSLATIEVFALQESTGVTFWKNGVQQTSMIWAGGVTRGVYQISLNSQPITTPFTFVDGLVINFDPIVTMDYGDILTLVIDAGAPDEFKYSINGVTQPGTFDVDTSPTSLGNGISIEWIQTTGHNIGDSWTIIYYPLIIKGWRQVYFTSPARLPGEGFRIQLDSNGWTMKPQQKSMYINGQAGEYYDVDVQDSSDLLTQTLSVQRLKTEQQKKALFPYLMESEPNYLSIVSMEKTWDILGQQKFLQLPQSKTLSDYVRVDFQTSDWTNGSQTYQDRKQFFVLPEEGKIFIYDDFMKYWHPPQVFGRRISSICFIDGQICGHSYERNETYRLFTEDRNDLADPDNGFLGYPISTRIALSYYDFNKRYNKKTTAAVAFDGYIDGNPEIRWKINYGVGGCEGITEGVISPIFCRPKDDASLGKSSLGYHGLGNSPVDVIPHFMYGQTFDDENYYMRNIELASDSLDQRWSITSIGTDVRYDLVSNADIFNPEIAKPL